MHLCCHIEVPKSVPSVTKRWKVVLLQIALLQSWPFYPDAPPADTHLHLHLPADSHHPPYLITNSIFVPPAQMGVATSAGILRGDCTCRHTNRNPSGRRWRLHAHRGRALDLPGSLFFYSHPHRGKFLRWRCSSTLSIISPASSFVEEWPSSLFLKSNLNKEETAKTRPARHILTWPHLVSTAGTAGFITRSLYLVNEFIN